MENGFTVSVHQYHGPLDLMLHLVKENKLDLFHLDVSALADQYIEYIHHLDFRELESASDYLSELANLIEYKSRKLLPRQDAELTDDYEEDNREALVQRLLEYQRFKEASEQLEQLMKQRQQQFDKPESSMANDYRQSTEAMNPDSNMTELLKAMNQVIRRYRIMQPLPVSRIRTEVTAEQRTVTLKTRINSLPETFSLEDLCMDCSDVYLVIVTFLSVLDMMKSELLIADMQGNEIYLKRGAQYGA